MATCAGARVYSYPEYTDITPMALFTLLRVLHALSTPTNHDAPNATRESVQEPANLR